MIKLRCVVEHITYQNPENGWYVMKVNVKGYKDLVALTGSLLDVPVGSVLLVDGDWRVDPKYGQQFVAQSWEEVKTADGIASKMGYGKNDPRRCRSGILYTLNELAEEGHVYAEPEQLVESAVKLLEAEETPVREALASMIEAKVVIADSEAIYLPPFYYAESGSAKRLQNLLTGFSQTDTGIAAESEAAYGARPSGIVYDEVQQAAIQQALDSKIMVLTGGPGTGKTTTTHGIKEAFNARQMQILLAAPTGRAAKRMTEATGMEAKTIHRLLEYSPMDGYKRNDENPLEGDALIVDECSMIDILLFYNLMKAVPEKMRLILVGDIDQLPSVGAGNELRDIIDSQQIPVVRLTRIFRQAQTSRIVMNAHAINAGKFPNIQNGHDTDFFFIKQEDADEMVRMIIGLVRDRLSRKYGYPPKEIQVLTSMQRGTVGAGNLNIELQKALNPSGPELTRGSYTYRQGDKVMQIRNNYDKSIFNGDIGYVKAVDTKERTLSVIFDGRMVEYDVSVLDELTLAYAVTIHKSQGSEFPVVVIPVTMKHFVMLQRNLIYMGITRAKKICVLVGTTKALAYAIRNQTVSKRNTKLRERLNPNKHDN